LVEVLEEGLGVIDLDAAHREVVVDLHTGANHAILTKSIHLIIDGQITVAIDIIIFKRARICAGISRSRVTVGRQ